MRVPLRKTPPKAKLQKFRMFPPPLACCSWLGNISTSSAQNEIPPIRVDVNVVSVPVTINNARGEFVGGLRRENFRLRVDGEEQPIEYFAAEEEPAQVLLLVETGPAVYLLRDEHTSAAAVLLSGLAPDDRVVVASYEQVPPLLAPAPITLRPRPIRPDRAFAQLISTVGRRYALIGWLIFRESAPSWR